MEELAIILGWYPLITDRPLLDLSQASSLCDHRDIDDAHSFFSTSFNTSLVSFRSSEPNTFLMEIDFKFLVSTLEQDSQGCVFCCHWCIFILQWVKFCFFLSAILAFACVPSPTGLQGPQATVSPWLTCCDYLGPSFIWLKGEEKHFMPLPKTEWEEVVGGQ